MPRVPTVPLCIKPDAQNSSSQTCSWALTPNDFYVGKRDCGYPFLLTMAGTNVRTFVLIACFMTSSTHIYCSLHIHESWFIAIDIPLMWNLCWQICLKKWSTQPILKNHTRVRASVWIECPIDVFFSVRQVVVLLQTSSLQIPLTNQQPLNGLNEQVIILFSYCHLWVRNFTGLQFYRVLIHRVIHYSSEHWIPMLKTWYQVWSVYS